MTNIDGVAVPLPNNDIVWEDWIQDLLTAKHQNTAVAYGRSGQKQHGIDFTVDAALGRIGVQCKFVKQGSKLDVNKVKADYVAARQLSPPLMEFHLYTSAESDMRTIDALAAFAQEVGGTGPTFRYFMWREFTAEARLHHLVPRLYGSNSGAASVLAGDASTNPVGSTRLVSQSETNVRAAASVSYGPMLDNVKTLVQQGSMAGAESLVMVLLDKRSELSDSELARVYATQAVLESRNSHADRAAQLWRKSAEIEPNEALQHARRAQAFLCEGKDGEAYAEAESAMTFPSPPSLAAVVLVISAGHLDKRRDAEALLTPRLKQERDVAIVRAYDALEEGRFEDADQIRRDLELEYPEDCDTLLIHANCRFQRALGGLKKQRPEAILGRARNEVLQARDLYQQALRRYDPQRERAVWLPAALNLISVLKILEQFRDAGDVAHSAIEHYGLHVEDFPVLVLALAEGGRASEALKQIEGVTSPTPALRIAQASALLHLNKFGDALQILEKIAGDLDGLDADNVHWMMLYARWKAEPGPDIERLAKDFYDKADNKLSACERIVMNASHLGFASLSEQYAHQAIALYEQAPDPDRRLFIANAQFVINDIPGAVATLAPAIDLDHPQDGPLEKLYAFCLLRLHRFESLEKLLGGIPADSAEAGRFDGFRIDCALQRGDRLQALTSVQAALERDPAEIKLRVLEVSLLREAGEIDQAKARLVTIEYRPQTPLNNVALYVREARLLGESDRADEFVYRWIRENGEDPENVAWFLAQFLLARQSSGVKTLDTVTSPCGVCLLPVHGTPREHWVVMDSRFPEAVAAGWFTPSSTGMASLIGKRQGDIVDLATFPDGPFKIHAILPIHAGAFKLLLSRYGSQIPMSGSLQQMSVHTVDGEPNFDNIFKLLDASRAASLQALAIYAETPISLGKLAELMHRNPLDVWRGLYGGTKDHIHSESAGNTLLDPVLSALQKGAPAITLDPVTLASWAHWGLLPLAQRLFRTISMSASAVDLIERKRAEVSAAGEGPQMQLGASDEPGRYTRTEITPAMQQAERNWLEHIWRFIEDHVTVCPTPITGLPEEIYSTIRHHWPVYIADQIQLAAHQQSILVADDLGIERLCVLLPLTQASTRLLFLGSLRSGLIGLSEYTSILAKLAEANYEFISFSNDDLAIASELHGLSLPPALVALLRYLSIPSMDLGSALRVLAHYWRVVIEERMSPRLLEATVSIALSALTRHATRRSKEIVQALDTFSRTVIGGTYGAVIHAAVSQWCRGHFLPAPPPYTHPASAAK